MKPIQNKHFIYLWITVIVLILYIGISAEMNSHRSPKECKEIITKIKNEHFKGVVYKKPIINKSTTLIIKSNNKMLTIISPCTVFYHTAEIGDSIIKIKNTNFIKIKKTTQLNWIKLKYKFIHHSCGDLHSCRIKTI